MAGPLTPAEGGGTWATFAQGEDFLAEVVAGSALAARVSLGRSAGGLPISAIVLGSPAPKPLGDASGAVVVFATQHGIEPAPREGAFRFLRDLAYNASSSDLALLATRPVIVVPTANPDGVVANQRVNANGVDLNRDHIALSQPESRAMASLMMAVAPLLVVDAHEEDEQDYQVASAYFVPGTAPPIKMFAPQIKAVMQGIFTDYTFGDYPLVDHEGTMQSVATLSGYPFILVETLLGQGAEARVDQHRRSMVGMFRFIAQNATAALACRDAAMASYRDEGAAAYAPSYGYESGPIPAVRGYTIPTGSPAVATLKLLGAKMADSTDGSLYVSMAQVAAGVIPLAIDARAPRPVIKAAPLLDGMGAVVGAKDGYTLPGMIVDTGGRRADARLLITHLGGKRTVDWAS